MTRKNSLVEAPYFKRFIYIDADGKSTNTPNYLGDALADYVSPVATNIEWRPNVPFEAELRLTTYGRGRSAVSFIFEDVSTGIQYSMFVSDFTEVVLKKDLKQGAVSGTWWVVKRGKNYGLALCE